MSQKGNEGHKVLERKHRAHPSPLNKEENWMSSLHGFYRDSSVTRSWFATLATVKLHQYKCALSSWNGSESSKALRNSSQHTLSSSNMTLRFLAHELVPHTSQVHYLSRLPDCCKLIPWSPACLTALPCLPCSPLRGQAAGLCSSKLRCAGSPGTGIVRVV